MLKLVFLALRVRRGWRAVPPAQRQRIVQGAGGAVRAHGPSVARRLGSVVREARKLR